MNENNLCTHQGAITSGSISESHNLEEENNSVTCPFSANKSEKIPILYKASEVTSSLGTSSSLGEILEWVNSFLAKPHKELGRKGPVCPFVPMSLVLDKIWFTAIENDATNVIDICDIVTNLREVFLSTEPTDSELAINKAFLIVFPKLKNSDAKVVDTVQLRLKEEFVEQGLMLGEFHAHNESPGLRNEAFRPLRSPIPMLAIRHMVDSDLPFLVKKSYPAELRKVYIRAYLSNLYNSLSRAKFSEALEYLIEAELQLSSKRASESDILSKQPV
ncbi:hypothetical protein PA25_12110 [Pseudoalteromonas sp. A25]|uniref:DUF6875 domain-containing protein n=1 Tax=Pseudoalteromonas sp. A25 TaxID=116092 RepID=UPI0012604E9B|nr:hypothetical protein [Pseudoalteromonas sp. A25]BBN81226.1 hypothetical protein PA25_12110 [Pseudoalteromonas sp. A25]